MHFTIACTGSHGDIRPYVALAVGLKARGHQARLIADAHAESLCHEWSIDFTPIEGEFASLIQPKSQSLSDSFRLACELVGFMKTAVTKQLHMLSRELKNTDALIYHPAVIASEHVAEKMQIPAFSMLLMPEVRTKCHAASIFPPKVPLGKFGNFASHLICEQIFWQLFRSRINRWRHEAQLSKISFFGPAYQKRKKNPILMAISPTILPRPHDWPSHVHMTGFPRLHTTTDWEPSQKLKAFLASGKAPLYIGFGSLSPKCSEDKLRMMLDIAQELNLRVILSGSLPGIQNIKLPESMIWIESAPHDWLFPKMAAAIHHGGAGTTAASLYAGIPTWIVPFILDQFHWGERAHTMGIGPKPLPIKQFNRTRFSQGLQQLLNTPEYKTNALAASKKLAEEDGINNAIDVLMQYLAS